MTGAAIVVLGTGAFATDLCHALAAAQRPDGTVHVVGRRPDAARAVCATVRAASPGARVEAVTADHTDPAVLRDVLAAADPRVVVQCASFQSPVRAPGPWDDLLTAGGFGLALPLQAVLATRTAAVCAALPRPPAFVNACFPDAVNTVVTALGHPVLCGLGNVASLADALGERLPAVQRDRLALLAHHAHLHPPGDPADDVRAWIGDTPLTDPAALLREARGGPRRALNRRGAHAGARLVHAVAHGGDLDAHAPGPGGLPGGYPIRLRAGTVTLRLPAGLGRDEAIAVNDRAAVHDGVRVGADGLVAWSGRAVAALRAVWPGAPQRFPVHEMEQLCRRQIALRDQLTRVGTP